MHTRLLPLLLTPAVACSAGEASIDDVTAALWRGPSTHEAALVTHTIPSTMRAGERLNVRLTVENTGETSPTDDWSASTYYLRGAAGFPFGLRAQSIGEDVRAGERVDIDFVVTAPAAGATAFEASMFRSGTDGGEFGPTFSIAVTTDDTSPPRWACGFVTSSPAGTLRLAPGEAREVAVTVRNEGLAPWSAGELCLRRTRSDDDLGGAACTALGHAVDAGETLSQTVTIVAPMIAGSYRLRRQMFGLGRPSSEPAPYGSGVGYFSDTPCVDISVEVAGRSKHYDGSFVSQRLPVLMSEGERDTASVTVENTGAAVWTAGEIELRPVGRSPLRIGTALVDVDVAPGERFTFNFDVRALAVDRGGAFDFAFGLFKSSAPAYGFGRHVTASILVEDYSVNAAVAFESFPRSMTVGETARVQVVLRNDGPSVWPAGSTRLRSMNEPLREWGLVQAVLPNDVAPGDSVQLTLDITAPATVGTYTHAWGMYLHDFFGETIQIPITVHAGPRQCASWSATLDIEGEFFERSHGLELTRPRSETIEVVLTERATDWQIEIELLQANGWPISHPIVLTGSAEADEVAPNVIYLRDWLGNLPSCLDK